MERICTIRHKKGSTIESIVYFELRRRGYKVYIGKNANKEIDFVARTLNEKLYVQVCRALLTDSDRETGNLLEIRDNYPKMVVTLDEYAEGNIEGAKIITLSNFLLAEEYN